MNFSFAGNPLEDLFLEDEVVLQNAYELAASHTTGFSFKEYKENYLEPLIDYFSWGIPNDLAINVMKQYSPIIEIGAGSGFWAFLLQNAGVDIVAYDTQSWATYQRIDNSIQWFQVKRGDENKILEHKNRNLFLCWPPDVGYPVASKALKLFSGTYVIYVGEGRGGSTADHAFFDLIDADFTWVRTVYIPHWPGFQDTLTVYKRKT